MDDLLHYLKVHSGKTFITIHFNLGQIVLLLCLLVQHKICMLTYTAHQTSSHLRYICDFIQRLMTNTKQRWKLTCFWLWIPNRTLSISHFPKQDTIFFLMVWPNLVFISTNILWIHGIIFYTDGKHVTLLLIKPPLFFFYLSFKLKHALIFYMLSVISTRSILNIQCSHKCALSSLFLPLLFVFRMLHIVENYI